MIPLKEKEMLRSLGAFMFLMGVSSMLHGQGPMTIGPEGKKLLAVGPLKIRIEEKFGNSSRADEGTLDYITEQAVYWQTTSGVRRRTDHTSLVNVTGTIDGKKLTWDRSARYKGIDGPVVPYMPLPKEMNVVRTEKSIEVMAFYALEFYLARYIECARDEPLSGNSDNTKRVLSNLDQSILDVEKLNPSLSLRVLIGHLKKLPEYRKSRDAKIEAAITKFGNQKTKLQIDALAYTKEIFQEGLDDAMTVNRNDLLEVTLALSKNITNVLLYQSVLNAGYRNINEELRKATVTAYVECYDKILETRRLLMKEGTKYGLPSVENQEARLQAINRFTEQSDWDGLERLFEKDAEYIKNNPFFVYDYTLNLRNALLRTGRKELKPEERSKRSEKLADLARKCLVAYRSIPSTPAYQRARSAILYLACRVATDACEKGLGSATAYVSAYDCDAMLPLYLCDLYELEGYTDEGANIRFRKALALSMIGRADEAINLIEKIESNEILKSDPEFGFKASRIYAGRGKVDRTPTDLDKSLKLLDRALENGFGDIPAIQKASDYRILRNDVKLNKELESRIKLTPHVSTKQVAVGLFSFGFGDDITILNKNKYMYTNIKFRAELYFQGQKDNKPRVVESTVTVSQLSPNQEVDVKGIFKGFNLANLDPKRSVAIITCDQGEVRIGGNRK